MQRRLRWRTLHTRRALIREPSECGLSTEGGPEGLWETKDNVTKHMKETGLPTATFFLSAGKINVVGAGKIPASWTASEDIGGTHYGEDPVTELNRPSSTTRSSAQKTRGSPRKTWQRRTIEERSRSMGWNYAAKKEGAERAGSANSLRTGWHQDETHSASLAAIRFKFELTFHKQDNHQALSITTPSKLGTSWIVRYYLYRRNRHRSTEKLESPALRVSSLGDKEDPEFLETNAKSCATAHWAGHPTK
ncbi:hypothetical protein F5146DRAFT_1001498 [Armillaria mellea]|nr:hypothetical protein F5146DRAFT_1001498 [Armillaria mellea]